MLSREELLEFLSENQIQYKEVEHKPVATVEDATKIETGLRGIGTKNLFLKDKKDIFYLVVIEQGKRVHMKELARTIRSDRLSFGSSEKLKEYLGVDPGAVTVLSIINDPEDNVKLFVDKEVLTSEFITCHPLVNTATVEIASKDLVKVFQTLEKPYKMVSIPEAPEKSNEE